MTPDDKALREHCERVVQELPRYGNHAVLDRHGVIDLLMRAIERAEKAERQLAQFMAERDDLQVQLATLREEVTALVHRWCQEGPTVRPELKYVADECAADLEHVLALAQAPTHVAREDFE